MGLFSRGGPAEAVHARVADGEHLWLAVRGAESLTLVRESGADLSVDAVTETHGDDVLLTAVVPIAAALADDASATIDLTLTHGRRHQRVVPAWGPRPASPTTEGAVTPDRRWQLSVHAVDGQVVVRRRAVEPTVAVVAITTAEDGRVEVRLDASPASVTIAGEPLPVVGDVVLLSPLADVPGLPVDAATPVLADGLPVVRAHNLMSRPHLSTVLPPLDDPDELRWLRDGRLAVFRHGADAAGGNA